MLDSTNAAAFRAFAHRALDDALDGLSNVAERPAWQPVPHGVKARLACRVPATPSDLEAVYAEFRDLIEPYENGNRHPRFMGWVHGNGTPSGMLAEMLAAALNANVGGREHSAVYVERAVIAWSAEIFGFPATASGILTSGTSLANLIAVLVARTRHAGAGVRAGGVADHRLVGYTSAAAHRCVPAAFDISGIGTSALRLIPTDARYRLDCAELQRAIDGDRRAGNLPFMVIATAGTVDTGAIDDLAALADLCAAEGLWLHIDGAFGALAVLSPQHRPLLRGIERADSIAFDFHKWLHVPYDAGCIIIRDADLHRSAFAHPAAYLMPAIAGAAGGEPWFADYGPELSRRFRALAIWFAFKEHGTQRLGEAIARNCRQAAYLAEQIDAATDVVRLAPVELNIVCFRYDDPRMEPAALDELNAAVVVDLQERGILVPSTTLIGGRRAIRINLTNYRVSDADLDAIVPAIRESGRRLIDTRLGCTADA
jgi:glutamate/tyrosine decarboxylase-like PLP-dependent enzyme